MPEISIRAARLNDSEDIKALLDRSWRTHWAPHLDLQALATYDATQPARRYVDACIAAIKVAERGGVVVGMFHHDGGMLHAMHVDSWAIGTGVGRALMDEAEQEGARRLEVRAFNTRARDFYARRGWVEVDEYADTEMGMAVRTIAMERL